MLIPNISAHLQMNMGFPRAQLGWLYLFGGLISFFGMRFTGRFVDRTSATRGAIVSTIGLILALFFGFVWWHHPISIYIIFALFMFSMSARNVCGQTLASKVPPLNLRAGFMSVNMAITHLFCAIGASISSLILVDDGQALGHMPIVASLAIGLSVLSPFLFAYVENHVKAKGVIIDVPLEIA
jgi:predicted MFS family arabinose efflux permease